VFLKKIENVAEFVRKLGILCHNVVFETPFHLKRIWVLPGNIVFLVKIEKIPLFI
jgi:hypothetical protein